MSDNAAKEFLLEEYKAFTNSMEQNEQSGETRVNWFLGIVTAAVGGLAKLFADGKIHGWPLRVISAAALVGLLIFGYVTLRRIMKRDKRTNELIGELDKIRQIFRDRFDAKLLADHDPFGRREKGDRERTFGGLADLVLTINSLLAAALVAALTMPVRSLSDRADSICWLIATCILAPAAVTLAFFFQRQLVKAN